MLFALAGGVVHCFLVGWLVGWLVERDCVIDLCAKAPTLDLNDNTLQDPLCSAGNIFSRCILIPGWLSMNDSGSLFDTLLLLQVYYLSHEQESSMVVVFEGHCTSPPFRFVQSSLSPPYAKLT